MVSNWLSKIQHNEGRRLASREARNEEFVGTAAEVLKLHYTTELDGINWPQVLELMMRRHRLKYSEAELLVRQFRAACDRLFPLRLFLRKKISGNNNLVLSSVGECHGADVIHVQCMRRWRILGFPVMYLLSIEFSPNFRRQREDLQATQSAKLHLRLFGREIVLCRASQVAFCYCLASIVGALFTAALLGLLLYSVAVFLVFIEQPADVTRTATNDGALGLALLCFLVVCAGVCGRAVANLSVDLRRKIRAWRSR